MKILTILGARPQFIKAGSVSREIAKHKEIEEVIVHTGQHFDLNMSDIFFEEMKIPKPKYNLNVNGLSHGAMTGQMLEKIEAVLLAEKPDWVMVYGDTNSTLAGAIAASKLQIRVAHVEAGLRSFNMAMPEEINRILTDRISNILFCPTRDAEKNLKEEGFGNYPCKIIRSGDVMQDGAIYYKQFARKPKLSTEANFILCTAHRAENTDSELRIRSIFEALQEIAKTTQVVMPLHPRTKSILEKYEIDYGEISIIDPVGYLEMIWLLDNCCLVMTDSGGLQKEAFFFGKLCLTLRDETEWVELVQHGVNMLVGSEKSAILGAYRSLLSSDLQLSNLSFPPEIERFYGTGNASKQIVEVLRT